MLRLAKRGLRHSESDVYYVDFIRIVCKPPLHSTMKETHRRNPQGKNPTGTHHFSHLRQKIK